MFVTKRRYFDFVTLFCLYQVCLKCRKLIYESFSANETSSAKSKKGPCSINELLHWFAKDEKGYPFLSIGSCADKTEKGTLFFINFAVTQKDWQIKFQDIIPIRAIFANTLGNDIDNGYPFS